MPELGFHHLAIQVQHLEATAAFYRDVLGLPELARHRREDGSLRAIWLGLSGGGFLALEEVPPARTPAEQPSGEDFRTERPGLLLLALRLLPEERGPFRERLLAHGVKVEHESRWTVYFRDPEGNRLGLSHHPHDLPGGGP